MPVEKVKGLSLGLKLVQGVRQLKEAVLTLKEPKSRPIPYWTEYKMLVPYTSLKKVVDGRAHLVLAGMDRTKLVTSPIVLMTEADGRIETLKSVYVRVKAQETLADAPVKADQAEGQRDVLKEASFLTADVGLDEIVQTKS